MKMVQRFGVGAVLLTLAVGCNNRPGGASKGGATGVTKATGEDEHEHGPGPHGGKIIEFGKWHGEFTVNPTAQETTVYVLGADAQTATPIPVETLLLSIKAPQFQVELKAAPQAGDPAGKSSRFVGKHEQFGKVQTFEGTLSGVVDGTPYAGDFKAEPEIQGQSPPKK